MSSEDWLPPGFVASTSRGPFTTQTRAVTRRLNTDFLGMVRPRE